MIDNTILEALKEFIKEEIAYKILLHKAPDENVEIEYVNPCVFIGYLPPKNFLPEGYDIPCIIVGEENGEDDGNSANLNIKLSFVTYGAGDYDENDVLMPDMQGYKDLLNLITRTRTTLSSNPFIKSITVIEKPIKWGMYQEQPFPYWYGYMTFTVNLPVNEMINTRHEKYL